MCQRGCCKKSEPVAKGREEHRVPELAEGLDRKDAAGYILRRGGRGRERLWHGGSLSVGAGRLRNAKKEGISAGLSPLSQVSSLLRSLPL